MGHRDNSSRHVEQIVQKNERKCSCNKPQDVRGQVLRECSGKIKQYKLQPLSHCRSLIAGLQMNMQPFCWPSHRKDRGITYHCLCVFVQLWRLARRREDRSTYHFLCVYVPLCRLAQRREDPPTYHCLCVYVPLCRLAQRWEQRSTYHCLCMYV